MAGAGLKEWKMLRKDGGCAGRDRSASAAAALGASSTLGLSSIGAPSFPASPLGGTTEEESESAAAVECPASDVTEAEASVD
mmetsp:Transcript_43477/g.85113  ORF Transcript_43477/g.85113 Transcript_43477/m.85113 type:complete len:82 (-) Transcript_43477:1934-2179(-)